MILANFLQEELILPISFSDPRPPYKSMANYMDGVFTLEMRKDLLKDNHANHPDFVSQNYVCSSNENSRKNEFRLVLSSPNMSRLSNLFY